MGSYLINEYIIAQRVSMFFLFYIIRIFLTVRCNDWILVWVGLEINIISFISLIFIRISRGVEACIKYFFIQRLGSGILIIIFYLEFLWFDYVILGVLRYKIGRGPFFFWFPSLCERLSWGRCFLLITVQKVLPLILISFLVRIFLWIIIFRRIFIGAIGSINQKRIKRLIAYSSIHHIGWILLCNFILEFMWIIYLIIYTILIRGIIIIIIKDNIDEVGRLWKIRSKWRFVLGILRIGGMPPLLGFYLKWWIFYYLMRWDLRLLVLIVVMSVLIFYVYFRVVYMLVIGGVRMVGWEVKRENRSIIGLDIIYIIGLNFGIIIWIIII